MAAGRRVLCQPDGLMDQIADDGILKVMVALSNTRALGASDRAFLSALATGSGTRQRCGTQLSSATGVSIDVAANLELFLVFDTILNRIAPEHGPSVCSSLPCAEGSRSFVAEPGLAGFVLAGSAPAPGLKVVLTDPEGATTTLEAAGPTRFSTAGTTIIQQWFGERSVDVQGDFDPARHQSWGGRWHFAFLSSEAAMESPQFTLWLRSALRPQIVGDGVPTGGSSATIAVDLVDASGALASATALARSANLRAQLTGGGRPLGLRTRRSGPASFAVEIPDARYSTHGATLELEARFPALGAPVKPVLVAKQLPPLARLGSPPLWLIVPAGLLLLAAAAFLVYVIRRRSESTKFSPPQSIRALLCDARVLPGTLVELRPDPGNPHVSDYVPLRRPRGRDGRARRIPHKGFTFLARPPLRPFAAVRPQVKAGGRQLVGGTLDGQLESDSEHRSCAIPLKLAGCWLFAVDRIDIEGQIHGQLMLLTAEGEPDKTRARVLATARESLQTHDWNKFEREQGLDDAPFAWPRDDEWQPPDDDWNFPILNGNDRTES